MHSDGFTLNPNGLAGGGAISINPTIAKPTLLASSNYVFRRAFRGLTRRCEFVPKPLQHP
jgi:hypothetical protein